jgi:hypothetical protein
LNRVYNGINNNLTKILDHEKKIVFVDTNGRSQEQKTYINSGEISIVTQVIGGFLSIVCWQQNKYGFYTKPKRCKICNGILISGFCIKRSCTKLSYMRGDRIDDLHKDVSDLQCISIEKIEKIHPRNIDTEVTL